MARDGLSPAPTRREILRLERAQLSFRVRASPEDGVESGASPEPVPPGSAVDLLSVDGESTSAGTPWGEQSETRRSASLSGRRRAAESSEGSIAGLPEQAINLMFVLQIRPWLFLDVVDLAILTGLSHKEVLGAAELLSGRSLIRTATRGNRVCYAAVP